MSTTPNSEQFTIDVTGETTGKAFKGLFKTKIRLSHRDNLRMDEIRRELLGKGAEYPSPRAVNASEIFSMLAIHLIEVPQWWKMEGDGLDLEDDNVVAEVYGRVVEAKAEALKKLKEEGEAARKELTEAK